MCIDYTIHEFFKLFPKYETKFKQCVIYKYPNAWSKWTVMLLDKSNVCVYLKYDRLDKEIFDSFSKWITSIGVDSNGQLFLVLKLM